MTIPFVDQVVERLKNSVLLKDSFWALLGSVLGKGLSLVAGILVARFLGKEMYGQFGILKNTLLNIAVFSTLGLGYTGTRFVAKYIESGVSKTIRLIYQITIVASSVMAIAVLVFAQPLAFFIKAPELDGALRLTAIIVIFNAINTSQIGILSGFKAFKEIAKNNVYAGIVTFILSGILAYFWALDGALWALLASTCFNVVINYLSVVRIRKHYALNETGESVQAKEIISFSIPIALQESMYFIVSFLSSYLLITYAGYGELGITSAAAQWSGVLLFIPGVMKNVMLSYFSSMDSTVSLRKKLILINGLSTFVPWLFIALLSRFIASFYGETFNNLHLVIIILCLGSIFSSISSVIVYEFISQGRNWTMFFLRLLRDGLSLLLAWYFLSHIVSIQGSIVSACAYTLVGGLFMVLLLLVSDKASDQFETK